MGTLESEIKAAAVRFGAHAVGIAAASDFGAHVPEGFRPGDLLRGAKSVITLGNRIYSTTGQWVTSNVDAVYRAATTSGRDAAVFGVANLIEKEYGYLSLIVNASMFDLGLTVPISLKVCAELSGLGTRSMAGGIILNKEHGLLGLRAVLTTMELKADRPLREAVCPDPACARMYEKTKRTPCMRACSAIHGTIENGRLKEVIWYRTLCATRALTTMNAAYLRLLPEIVREKDEEKRRWLAIGQARKYMEDPPGRGIRGRCIECMRVCPVNRRAVGLQKGESDA